MVLLQGLGKVVGVLGMQRMKTLLSYIGIYWEVLRGYKQHRNSQFFQSTIGDEIFQIGAAVALFSFILLLTSCSQLLKCSPEVYPSPPV